MFKEFRDLRRKADRRRSLPDLLNFSFAEDDYTIVMKDGARLVAFECQGQDLNSASPEELDAHRALTNRAFLRLDEGFAYQIDHIRYPSASRAKRVLADPVSSMIDHEGALHYAQEGRHHESRTVIPLPGGRHRPWRAGQGGYSSLTSQRRAIASVNAHGSSNSCRNSWPRSVRYGSWCR
jgi:hypothetical protein